MFTTGRLCAKHPELEGKRYARKRECPACVSAQIKAWKENNTRRNLDLNLVRKRLLKKATPKWANLEIVAAFYTAAAAVRAAGHPCEVDHIVPLQHPLVCGLHCEANLQIMLKADNLKKGNRWWPDMPQSA